jgi:hypothetical protein
MREHRGDRTIGLPGGATGTIGVIDGMTGATGGTTGVSAGGRGRAARRRDRVIVQGDHPAASKCPVDRDTAADRDRRQREDVARGVRRGSEHRRAVDRSADLAICRPVSRRCTAGAVDEVDVAPDAVLSVARPWKTDTTFGSPWASTRGRRSSQLTTGALYTPAVKVRPRSGRNRHRRRPAHASSLSTARSNLARPATASAVWRVPVTVPGRSPVIASAVSRVPVTFRAEGR